MSEKLNLAVVFGARSSEHDVSIVSAFQAIDWINSEKYRPFFIYLDQDNRALLCPRPQKEKIDYQPFITKTLNRNQHLKFTKKGIELQKFPLNKTIKLDAALLIMHGPYGEDGRIQGLLDFYDIPYTGCGVLGNALAMDKVISKAIFTKMSLPTAPYLWFWKSEFDNNTDSILEKIQQELDYPLFVKPAKAGSSVGISKVAKKGQLKETIAKAARFDQKILIEQSLEKAVDINCAVMGGLKPTPSVCEQPITEEKFLSFEEKYLKGGKSKGMAGLSRIVPAPIPEEASQKIQKTAVKIFREFNCWGMVRIDFLYQEDKQKIYPNEINAIPGSLAFYLWEASGIEPEKLIDRLVELARQRSARINSLSYSFTSPLLDQK